MVKVLMVRGNTETYVDELEVEEMEEKGFEVVEITPKPEVKPEGKRGK